LAFKADIAPFLAKIPAPSTAIPIGDEIEEDIETD
jgi:hypothetical protein